MALAIEVVLQWVHVFFGIFWFGAILYSDFILIPVLQGLSPQTQGEISGPLGRRTDRVILLVGVLTVAFGIFLGIADGVISTITSAYGLTWLGSLLLGIVLIVWGVRVIGPAARGLSQMTPGPQLAAAIARVRTLALLELGMFVVIFSLMIAMHFGV